MKYQSVDHLEDFEFHDAKWSLVSYDSEKLVVTAKYLNIHDHTLQNTSDCDMEIQSARMTFVGCRIIDYEPGVPWESDAFGNSHPTELMITYTNQDAEERFLRELQYTATIFSFEKENDGAWEIAGCGNEPYFESRIAFDFVIVEWEEYHRPAWYILRERGIQA